MKTASLLFIFMAGCGEAFAPDFFPPDAGGAAGAVGAAGSPSAAGAAGRVDDGGTNDAQDAQPDVHDAACEPQTAVRHCGECQPGYYLSRLYDETAGCLYLLRDCSVPCGTFLWCEWGRSTPCLTGWKSAGRLSTPECGTGSDPIDGHNTTICEPLP